MSEKLKLNIWFLFTVFFTVGTLEFSWCNNLKNINLFIFQTLTICDLVYKIVRKQKIKINYNLLISAFFLLIVMTLSNCFAFYKQEAIIKEIKIVDFIIFTSVLLPNYFYSINIKKILKTSLISMLSVIVCCVIIFHNDYTLVYDSDRIGSAFRLVAGFSHPNILGFFTFTISILSIILLLISKERKKQLIITFLLGLFFSILSDSRTAIIGIIIFILIYYFFKFIYSRENGNMIHFVTILVSIILIILLFLFLPIDTIDIITSHRINIIINSVNHLKYLNRLVLGIGAIERLAHLEFYSLDTSYFNMIYQFGFMFLIPLVLYLFNYIKLALKTENIKNKCLSLSIIYTFIMICFFEDLLINLSNYFSILSYTLIILLYYDRNDGRDSNEKR